MYSSIQKKYGKCIDCSPNEPEQYIIAKRCPNHYKIYRAKIQLEKQKTRNKVRSLHSLPANKSMVEKNKDVDIDLENYFRLAAGELSMNNFCMECGNIIPATIKRLKGDKWVEVDNFRNYTAHIFPKALFPSVRANPYNKLYLCASNGCHEKSHRLDTFSKMKIFPEAVRRFRLFENDIKESSKYLHLFLEYANQL